MIRSDDPLYNDPRFQRRVVGSYRPFPIIDNVHDVTLDCGHAPLMFADTEPKSGTLLFCPDCYDAHVKFIEKTKL